jgi:alkylation response protein AidB-like acyl-CoA dehydrogenase
MQLLATEEETMLREGARRALAEEATGDRWERFAQLGWLMAALPEEAGGLGWGPRAAAIVAEELGRADGDEPFVDVAVMATQALLGLRDPGVQAIGEGGARAVLAHNEAAARGAPDWVEAIAEPGDGGYRISGAKHAIVAAPDADRLLVTATVPGKGLTLFDVRPDAVSRKDYALIDGRSASDIRLDGAAADPVGPIGGAQPAITRAFDHALVLGAAQALGTMQRAFDMTRDYLLTRRQYGKVIGDFQALRHRLADMFIEVEQARSMVALGVAALDGEDARERSRIASATKARVAQAGLFVTGQAIQLHGGIGLTREYPVGGLFTRMVVFDQRFGAADAHVERFAALASA